jgi:hypothetical protein
MIRPLQGVMGSQWGRFSSSYIFRHTAALYLAATVCAFAEDRYCMDVGEDLLGVGARAESDLARAAG